MHAFGDHPSLFSSTQKANSVFTQTFHFPFSGCAVMVVPHFSDYIAFKLDPVACLKYLKDAEVTQSCEALKTTIYVACVTHLFCFPLSGVEYISVSMTLVSQGLPDGHPDRFILPDMAVPILPNNFNPLSLSPGQTVTTLPLPRHIVVFETILSLGIRGSILNIKQERLLENYNFQGVARRDTLWKEQEAILAIDNAEDVDDTQLSSPRKRKFSSVDSSDHSEDSDDAEEDKPDKSRRRQKGPRKGKQKAPTSELKDYVSEGEESNGNEDYVSSATENDNLSDLADGSKPKLYTSSSNTQCGAQPHQLRSGREYGPNKSRLNKEAASQESPRPSHDRESPGVIRSAILSVNDSGSDEPNGLSIRGSTPRRTPSPDTQGIPRRRPPELGPTHAYMPNSHQAASSSKRRRTAYRVISSSEDESRSPSPELERPARRFRRLRRWSEHTA
ncbi:hypothetical protein IW261DRAFT_1608998 [Armillaria novae-zelandiae]|uniref:Uncharacterized protein n=1 Tax=Armillaria novae-zelandiae TaxID=153914 RepID=A0AA39P4P2_9AGAR|nr:hypothetical protein IW261DRAFT_1608998 [Armillaria novae-zelandiae]